MLALTRCVTAHAHHFFCLAEFCDFICRLRDDPDACHAYALRCAAKNSLNWRLTAERCCTFTELHPSAFEPDSSIPMTALTLTVLPTTTDRISTLSVACVLAAYGCRHRLCAMLVGGGCRACSARKPRVAWWRSRRSVTWTQRRTCPRVQGPSVSSSGGLAWS